MIEKVQEPIEVLSRFVEGKVQPMRFRWRGRVFTVSRITSTWMKRVGDQRAHFFSVGVGTHDHYELSFQPRSCQWTLENIYEDG
jgi:hypothetical protein